MVSVGSAGVGAGQGLVVETLIRQSILTLLQ
jgi:hypothetical protein